MRASGLPGAGHLNVGSGAPIGSGVVDFLASAPEQRIWWVLRHVKPYTAADTGGDRQFFDATTANARDGNVERPHTLPEPQIYFVFGVTLRHSSATSIADAQLLADSLHLTVTINQQLTLGPLNYTYFGSGAGLYAGATIVTNGMPSAQLQNWLPIPIVEKGGEAFTYTSHITETLAAISADRRVECAQHGILFRRAVSQ